MSRRTRLVAIALGLAVLLWGMASLQRIFMRERSDALASLEGRQQALEQFARRELEQMLRDELAGAAFGEIEEAAKDPLAPADGLFLELGGQRILPRPFVYASGDGTPAKALYEALAAGDVAAARTSLALDGDDPFGERLTLFARFRGALDRRDVPAIQESFRAILSHRSRFLVAASRDVPLTLAVVERFLAKSKPDRGVLRQVIRDGFGDPMPGLQRTLLERRAKLTKADFEFLAKRISAVSSELEARHDDFELAAFEEPDPAPDVPSPLEKPMLLADRTWYVEPIEEGRIEGIAIELPAILDTITLEMRDRGLMHGDDRIALVEPSKRPGGPEAPQGEGAASPKGEQARSSAELLADLPLRADSVEWAQARAAIASRYRLKSALGILLGALAAGVAGLALLLQARERRFLELKSDFVATVSHELRTPLAAVRLLAETLEKKVAGHPDAKDYPGRIVSEVDSLSFLVENILSFNRLEKGRVVPRIGEVRVSEILDLVRTEAPLRATGPVTVTLEGDSGAGDLVLAADPELAKLLFLNLASNACKHNKRSPVTIGIAAANGGRAVTVAFRDNGVGIAEADRERVFEDFYRGSATNARGFGLGLAICRRIMRLHGGEIRVAESSPDGTRFELSFPVAK